MNRIPPEVLYRLRNDVDLTKVVELLGIPRKRRGERLAFHCPECGTMNASASSERSLAHCFHCQRNFNSIDLVMAERGWGFLEAVDFLKSTFFWA
jgi:DNA primase